MPKSNLDSNPFTAELKGVDIIDQCEDLNHIMENIRLVNRLRWEHLSLIQLIAMPFQWLYHKLPKKEQERCIYMKLAELYEEGSQCNEFWDIDIDFYSSLFEIERRKSENKFLRKVYNKVANEVKYHMLPKTVEVEQRVA